MANSSELRKILIVGAGGKNIGHHIAKALSNDSDFTVSILARKSSKSRYPANTTTIPIDDSMTHEQLVQAFEGQDAIVSGMGFEGKANELKMIDAAIEAGVKRFIPSEYGINNRDERARNLAPVFTMKGETQDYLISKEGSGLSWTAVATGLWLDWALDPGFSFLAIDIKAHTANYWANGTHRTSFTTLPTAADAVRCVLMHPAETANRLIPVRNFEASQREVVALLERIQGVEYTVTNIEDCTPLIKKAKDKWAAEQDIMSAVELIKAGFLLDGYGSNLAEDSEVAVANELIGFDAESAKCEQVVEDAVRAYCT